MTKDNHLLGKFELNGIPPAPRGVPQIEVTFEIDANGVLQVAAEDTGAGKTEKITITAEKGRLSEEEIERMVREAEEFADEDAKVKEKVDLRNALNDEEKGIADKISEEDKEKLEEAVKETLDWLDENDDAEVEEFEEKQKELEGIANPIMSKIYQQGGGGAGGGGGKDGDFDDEDDDDFDFDDEDDDHDEL